MVQDVEHASTLVSFITLRNQVQVQLYYDFNYDETQSDSCGAEANHTGYIGLHAHLVAYIALGTDSCTSLPYFD